ncbi:hypothetical protein [Sphingobacterium sp. UGAL515B_05]|uniref:hypothetical protein n=1 Tax=Sphingobacterium sp. UGAL515B_05 TaxID=2986767 RepID=UPI00295568F9|nr:hypothetical protein [Sphingobacterium sp. UGAL515B_05]WON94763.1 hypothetical protein OK025_26450 [Sphingobacterium sp. UGAL515B_05]
MFRLELDMTPAEIDAIVDEEFRRVEAETLEQFKMVLAEALKIQRATMRMGGGYDDQTGQLRSSTGGIIFKDGKVLFEDFELSPYGTDKEPGLKEGRELAYAQLRTSKGWGIIVVAGKEYAGWVEGRGLTVITLAQNELEKVVDKAFERISV